LNALALAQINRRDAYVSLLADRNVLKNTSERLPLPPPLAEQCPIVARTEAASRERVQRSVERAVARGNVGRALLRVDEDGRVRFEEAEGR
jgi:hypothetical protein